MSFFLTRKRVRKITRIFNSEKGIKYIPYRCGYKFINWFCGTDFAQNKFFSKKTPILKEFLAHFPDKYDEEQTSINFLRVNFLQGWRYSKFSNLSDRKFLRKLELHGYDIFLKHYEENKGIVLVNSHFGIPPLLMSMFPALGYDNFYSIVGENYLESSKNLNMRKDRTPNFLSFDRSGGSEFFQLLYKAKEILESGGILHVLGDGMHGKAQVYIDFLGKERGFRSSFAELGLIAGSPIIPVFAYPGKSGAMHVEFYEPLPQGAEDDEHEDRIKLIIEGYSKILQDKWMESPYQIRGGFMEMYNKQLIIKKA